MLTTLVRSEGHFLLLDPRCGVLRKMIALVPPYIPVSSLAMVNAFIKLVHILVLDTSPPAASERVEATDEPCISCSILQGLGW